MDENILLTFENFESVIDPEIVERGRDYFQSGNVVDLEEDDGIWTATVVGTYDYAVEIEQEVDGYLTLSCDCPYEWGPYCKHEVALLFAIRAERKRGKPVVREKQQQRQSVRGVVEALTHDQLVEIVMEQVKRDKSIGNQILLRFGDETPDQSLYQRSIQDIIRKYSDHGFLDYQETRQAAFEIHGLLSQAEAMINDKRLERALPILRAVIETVPASLNHADDSAGELGGSISQALQLLEKVAAEGDSLMRQTLFDYCLQEHSKPQHQGWDYPANLLWQASELVETQSQREVLFSVLDGIIKQPTAHHIDEYEKENALRLRIDVMQRMGDLPEAIHMLLLENVHLNRPRQQLVSMYIEQKQFAAARRLCLEAVEMYQRQWPGLVIQYEEWLLEIAQKENDVEGMIELAQKLLLEGREFDRYYDVLKASIQADEWPVFRQKLIQKIETEVRRWGQSHLLGEIYKREHMWPELLDLARRSGVGTIETYRKELHKRFPNEMCDIYEAVVLREMERASNRDQYHALCDILRRMVDLGQPERASEIVERLKASHPRRRAMIEELNKV